MNKISNKVFGCRDDDNIYNIRIIFRESTSDQDDIITKVKYS